MSHPENERFVEGAQEALEREIERLNLRIDDIEKYYDKRLIRESGKLVKMTSVLIDKDVLTLDDLRGAD